MFDVGAIGAIGFYDTKDNVYKFGGWFCSCYFFKPKPGSFREDRLPLQPGFSFGLLALLEARSSIGDDKLSSISAWCFSTKPGFSGLHCSDIDCSSTN